MHNLIDDPSQLQTKVALRKALFERLADAGGRHAVPFTAALLAGRRPAKPQRDRCSALSRRLARRAEPAGPLRRSASRTARPSCRRSEKAGRSFRSRPPLGDSSSPVRATRLEVEREQEGFPDLRQALRGECGDERSQAGPRNRLDVIEVGGARLREPVIGAQRDLGGDAANRSGDRGDGRFCEVLEDGISSQDDDRALLVRPRELVPTNLATPQSPHTCSFDQSSNSPAPAGFDS